MPKQTITLTLTLDQLTTLFADLVTAKIDHTRRKDDWDIKDTQALQDTIRAQTRSA